MGTKSWRRNFCRQTAVAGAVFVAVVWTWTTVSSGAGENPPEVSEEPEGDSISVERPKLSPVLVVTQHVTRDANPRGPAWHYVNEVMQRAGVFFDQNRADAVSSDCLAPYPVVLLAGDLVFSAEQRQALTAAVRDGASLIGVGGTSGLDEVFGVARGKPLAEGWIRVTDADHPVTTGLRSSLHVFGGYAFQATSAIPLAVVDSGRQGAKGNAILENRFGEGRAILLGPDLLFSIVHIQQGVPVLQDAKPPTDDSAPVDDGELKAEDGLVLDWERDRTPMQADSVPVFLEPITDELREILLRSILYAAIEQNVSVPVLWYWPRGLQAVGHISHDTDGHDPAKAEALLKVINRCGVKSTWCTLYPGGYPQDFYAALKQQGFEIALHYDARSGGKETSWSRENFLLQHRWLLDTAGLEQIVSNKNHYTRWEQRLDFLRWCEAVGVYADQTRGPSKQGTIGFPLGGSQPYFPLDDEVDPPRMLNVLEVNLLTQDLVVVCPASYGHQLLESALRHHGVAHFLFHPAHIEKPGVADALYSLVDYGRQQGLEWWTSEQIYRWEMLRRGVRAEFTNEAEASGFRLETPTPVAGAKLLFPRAAQAANAISIDGKRVQTKTAAWMGFACDSAQLDLADGCQVEFADDLELKDEAIAK